MQWLRAHPYTDAIALAGTLLIVGVLVVQTHRSVPARTEGTWGSAGGIISTGVASPIANNTPDTGSIPTQAYSIGYIAPHLDAGESGNPNESHAFMDDLEALIASVSGKAKQKTEYTGNETTSPTYSFIPSGLIATTTLATGERSPLQEALYTYGNEVGNIVQSFEAGHPDQPAILKNHIENRTSPQAIAALKRLGEDLVHVGDEIEAMAQTPPQARSAHTKLVTAYRSIGTKLAAIPDNTTEDSLYDAIMTYNTAAEGFARDYVSLVSVFQSYAVTFGPNDGGSIFVFPSSGGGL